MSNRADSATHLKPFSLRLRSEISSILREADQQCTDVPPAATAGVLILGAASLLCMYYLFSSPRTGHQILTAIFSYLIGAKPTATLLKEHLRVLYLLWWVSGSFVFYLLLPMLYIHLGLRRTLSDFGLSTDSYRIHLPLYGALFAPVAVGVVLASFLPSFKSYYPIYRNPATGLFFLIWEIFYLLQFFALEFFFRGFLLHGLKGRYGSGALWIMVFPYFMIHFGKPWPEAVGAFLAGTALGLLSLRTGSILGGVTIHAAVALLMDILACWQRGWF